MEKTRIVFMGTPDFAVTILQGLVHSNYNVVGVVTVADKPAGRGRKVHQSPVKTYAIGEGIPVLQPLKLKDPSFISALQEWKADVQVVVAFRMLPKVIWSMPKLGTFNLHASLLPDYRGAAPINWAIINGETKTGVTTFFIDEKIDTGAIILQEEIAIGSNEHVGALHDRLMHLGTELVLKTIDVIENGSVTTVPQPTADLKLAPKLYPETCRIDWNDETISIYNKIRGLNPFPTAWTTLKCDEEHIQIKLYDVQPIVERHELSPGTIATSKTELKIATSDGFIKIDSLKMAGKRKMDARSFLNGFTFPKNSKLS